MKQERFDNFKKGMEHPSISPKTKRVVAYRFGLVTGKIKTLDETGKRFRITKQRVAQHEARAYEKLIKLGFISAHDARWIKADMRKKVASTATTSRN